jgi:hypothetical protein
LRIDLRSNSGLAVPATLTPDGYVRARRVLMRRDPVLGALIRSIGPCRMADRF